MGETDTASSLADANECLTAVIRFKFANMSRETEALQSWVEVSNAAATSLEGSFDNETDLALRCF